jgi:hypothetical protein
MNEMWGRNSELQNGKADGKLPLLINLLKTKRISFV